MLVYAIITVAIYIIGYILYSFFIGYASYKAKGYAEKIEEDDIIFHILWPVTVLIFGLSIVAKSAVRLASNFARKVHSKVS